MAIDVPLPSYSESMEEADVIGWLVSPGDHVNAGDPIAEIETDKATGELESPVSGTLVEICVAEGTAGVKVGAVVARIEPEAESNTAETPPAPAPAPAAPSTTESAEEPPPAEEPVEETAVVEPTPEPGAGLKEAVTEPASEVSTPTEAAPVESPSPISATALARRLADQQGIDLQNLRGTGHKGRITKADIEAVGAGPATQAPDGAGASGVLARLEAECHIERAVEVCGQLGSREHREEIPLIAIIVRAAAVALQEIPEPNSVWNGTELAQGDDLNIILEAIENGADGQSARTAITGANRKSLLAIAEEIEAGSSLSRENPEAPAPMESGLMIVDVSALNIERIQPALLQPAVACLGIGSVTSRVVADEGSSSGAHLTPTIHCSLVIDSRAVPLRSAARWLQNFRTRLEDPLEMLL